MTDDRKILLIANILPPVRGGSAVVYENLARHSNRRVSVLAPRLNYLDGLPIIGWREHDRNAPYRIVRLPLLRTLMTRDGTRNIPAKMRFLLHDLLIRIRVMLAVGRLILTQKLVAVCLGELLASGWLLAFLRLFPNVRTLVYVHGEELTTRDPYDSSGARRRRILSEADHIVAVSRFTLGIVRELLGPAAVRKTSLIENGVDTSKFVPMEKPRYLLDLYGLIGTFVLVSVCRLLEKKGIDNALRAFAIVARQYPDCRYLIVGTGPYEAALKRIAGELGLSEKVRFAGEVPEDELVEHYCLGDVFIMPNRELQNGDTEGFGLVFLEANSCGLPVIAGCAGGSANAVSNGVNGLVVDGTRIDEITAAITSLREDQALRHVLREGGLRAAAAADWREKAEIFTRICCDPAA